MLAPGILVPAALASGATPIFTRDVAPILFRLGIETFDPQGHAGGKIAVKGVLIEGVPGSRINVISLQTLSTSCEL